MSIITSVVEALVMAGATPEMILAAVRAFEDQKEIKEDNRRAKDAERQRRHRASRDVTVTECDNLSPLSPPLDGGLSFSPAPLILSNLNPPLNPPALVSGRDSQEIAPQKREKANRGTRLHIDWDLPDDWGEWAEKQGMTRDSIIRECDKFKDFWIAKTGPNATKAHWEATWRNWIRKHLEGYGNEQIQRSGRK